jgi:hypothetical protein
MNLHGAADKSTFYSREKLNLQVHSVIAAAARLLTHKNNKFFHSNSLAYSSSRSVCRQYAVAENDENT